MNGQLHLIPPTMQATCNLGWFSQPWVGSLPEKDRIAGIARARAVASGRLFFAFRFRESGE
jgi:hypothetical protein